MVTPLTSPFGIVDVSDDGTVAGFRESPKLPHWVNVGVYVLDEEAIARLPERGDHETSTFPELAEEGRLRAFAYEGEWLTVNTPKDLERAEQHLRAHPRLFGALTPRGDGPSELRRGSRELRLVRLRKRRRAPTWRRGRCPRT